MITKKFSHPVYAGILTIMTLFMCLPGIASIPVIDRDESRFAQATVQMIESGEYLDIKFQDDDRYKKPSGSYWAQAAFVKPLTAPGERKIWAHRIPSVLAAIFSVLLTYWAGVVVLGRRGAFISAAILGSSTLFVFEAHIAKTDALLCATAAAVLAVILRHRAAPNKRHAFILWAALGLSILIKGPVVPLLFGLTLISLYVWERDKAWLKNLFDIKAIALFLVITVPWAIAITMETGGAFWAGSLGTDLGSKVTGASENHGGWPGYYLISLPVFFWPGILFLPAGLVFAKTVSAKGGEDNPHLASAMKVLLCWAIPFWILMELIPTKLPNYLLPVYPALALMSGGAVMALISTPALKRSRRIGAALFFIASCLTMIGLLSAEASFSDQTSYVAALFIGVLVAVYIAAGDMWRGKAPGALQAAAVCGLLVGPAAYWVILPSLNDLFVARNVEVALASANKNLPRNADQKIFSPHFTEPSLVYRLGTNIVLGDRVPADPLVNLNAGDMILVDKRDPIGRTLFKSLSVKGEPPLQCAELIGEVSGTNYSKGSKETEIAMMEVRPCLADESIEILDGSEIQSPDEDAPEAPTSP